MRTRITRLAAAVTLAAGVVLVGVGSPAQAASGGVDNPTGGARTYFHDDQDIVIVSDRAGDTHAASGWIEIKQADGSWVRRPGTPIYVPGEGNFQSIPVNVQREAADVRLVACLQDGQNGQPYSCGRRIISGS
ncbi:hypothetical protein [Aeromicrobium massiliense]|uniref:hypothetical protein n=1 Tax=Aeromicrobium massiliense TaxID=1464554 RepID=UPI00030FE359|nr:hypothetical protein [Aeromicrobium massiliense]